MLWRCRKRAIRLRVGTTPEPGRESRIVRARRGTGSSCSSPASPRTPKSRRRGSSRTKRWSRSRGEAVIQRRNAAGLRPAPKLRQVAVDDPRGIRRAGRAGLPETPQPRNPETRIPRCSPPGRSTCRPPAAPSLPAKPSGSPSLSGDRSASASGRMRTRDAPGTRVRLSRQATRSR